MLSIGAKWKHVCKVSYNDLMQADDEFQVNGLDLADYLRQTAGRRDKDRPVRVTLSGYHFITRRNYGWANPCERFLWCKDERGNVFPYRPFKDVREAQAREPGFFDTDNRGFFKDSGYSVDKNGVLRIKFRGDRDPAFYVDRVGVGFFHVYARECTFTETAPKQKETGK